MNRAIATGIADLRAGGGLDRHIATYAAAGHHCASIALDRQIAADVAIAHRFGCADRAIAADIIHSDRLAVDNLEIAADLLDLHHANAVQSHIAARLAHNRQRRDIPNIETATDILDPHGPIDILDLDIAAN